MSFCANVSELAREIRIAAGTVLTTLGSRLEADARAQVECGPQWLTEFEKQRDSLEPRAVCELHGAWCAFDPSCGNHLKGSAAVSAAADPSPARPSPSPASAVDEGSGGASDILQSAPPEQPTPCAACDYADNGWCPCKCHGESDPGEVSRPSPGEQVTEDDLAAHIMGDFISGQDVDPLTATLIDAISSRIARCLLADFHVTKK